MASEEPKKRKACVNCTHAKAKCTPSLQRPDSCERCSRLKKSCVYLDSLRRKGPPRTRSRVQQLEQKVENLMNVLALGNRQAHPTLATASTSPGDSESSAARSTALDAPGCLATDDSSTATNPGLTPEEDDEVEDIIERGIITHDQAVMLLTRFKSLFVPQFPFVAIPSNCTVDLLRQEHPFLFLCIIAVTCGHEKELVRVLDEEVKQQITVRTVISPQKDLEVLQGILVYLGWYHFFFKPGRQTLAVLLQICVALVQDLGIDKNAREKGRRCVPTIAPRDLPGGKKSAENTPAEKRAVLGVFYLLTMHAQTWRQRPTMVCSPVMKKWAQSLADANEIPTDSLIKPLIQLQDLASRVNSHFSLYDVDSSELTGESILEMSTCTFRSELENIKTSTPLNLQDAPILALQTHLVSSWIHEVSIHPDLWNPDVLNFFPSSRIAMLWRAVQSTKAQLQTIASYDPAQYHSFSLPIWCGWFYAVMVGCKLAFLYEFNTAGFAASFATGDPSMESPPGSWDPIAVEKEAQIVPLFEKMIANFHAFLSQSKRRDEQMGCPFESAIFKLEPALLRNAQGEAQQGEGDHLTALQNTSGLQRRLLAGYKKRLAEHEAKINGFVHTASSGEDSNQQSSQVPAGDQHIAQGRSQINATQGSFHWNVDTAMDPEQQFTGWPGMGVPDGGIGAGQFPMDFSQGDQSFYDDMVWDTMIADFTLPSM